MIGTCVGSYRITGKISVGGMGVVYRAEHQLIGKPAAVKILHPELSGSKELIQRFFNEAKATTAIQHPGIVDIFDYGYMKSGHAYIIMELLDGMSLARRIKTRGRMSESDAAMLLRALCSPLGAAHAKGIVHRDLKPDNIYLVPDGEAPTGERVKILDFGIAKLTESGLAGGTATKTGAVMGTPTYMSPEQCKGTGEVDQRADLYALGCIFYELVAGRPPFTAKGGGELIGAHLYLEPEPASKHAAITADTDALITSLLAKEPAARPQSTRDLAMRLADIIAALGGTVPTARTVEDFTPVTVEGAPAFLRTTEPPDPDDDRPTSTPGAIAIDKPTTLRGAAGQSSISDARPKSRKWVAAVAGMAVVAAGLGVAFMVRGGDEEAAKAPIGAKGDGESNVDPAKADSAKADSARADSAKADSRTDSAARFDSAGSDPAPAKADSARFDSAGSASTATKFDSSKSDSAKSDSTKANSTKANSTKAAATKADSAKADSTKAAATKADSTKTDVAKKPVATTAPHPATTTPPPAKPTDAPKPPEPAKNPLIETDL